ncbi:hypothetical protein F350042L8_33570 [Fusobacterium ulcerans]
MKIEKLNMNGGEKMKKLKFILNHIFLPIITSLIGGYILLIIL